MSDMMTFPDTWEDFEKSYGFTDNEEVYTNGARLIPSFRVKQWLDHMLSAQPEREKGKWIVNETLINCSVCKHSSWSRHAFEDIVRGFNFCPNCGKPMKRGKQDE